MHLIHRNMIFVTSSKWLAFRSGSRLISAYTNFTNALPTIIDSPSLIAQAHRRRDELWDTDTHCSTCAEEIVHALAVLHIQVQRCTCTHLGVHRHTNASTRMHPPAGRRAMQVGVEWNAGRNAGLLPAGRTVHYRVTNSSLQRVGPAISRLSSLSFYIRAAFCTCSWNDDYGTRRTEWLFYRAFDKRTPTLPKFFDTTGGGVCFWQRFDGFDVPVANVRLCS